MKHERALMVCALLVTSLCGGALASLLFGARVVAQGPQAVTTTQVNLVDPDGVLRAVLSARDERGTASLTFYDEDGQVRGVFGVEQTGAPVLRLRNAAGEDRIAARVLDEDALLIVGDDRQHHALLASAAGTPVLSLSDGMRSRAQLQIGEDGSPSLVLFGHGGQRAVAVTVDSNDTPVVTLYGEGRPRVTLGVVQQAAVLNLAGAAQSRLVIGVADNGRPSITFVDNEGRVIDELP